MAGYDLPRRLVAEALGIAFLLAGVVGSGIMGERLADGNVAIALLGNTIATGAILAVLILVFGPISGAHFNPAVTVSFAVQRALPWREAPFYIAVQVAAGLVGVICAHLMFGEPVLSLSSTARTGAPQWLGEFVATIIGCLRAAPQAVPHAVRLFITSGYWFTSSTSFANPAVTIARSFTDTFSGIAPAHMPAFLVAQFVGAIAATLVFRWLLRSAAAEAAEAPSPQPAE